MDLRGVWYVGDFLAEVCTYYLPVGLQYLVYTGT
jgi:hypothetical protein